MANVPGEKSDALRTLSGYILEKFPARLNIYRLWVDRTVHVRRTALLVYILLLAAVPFSVNPPSASRDSNLNAYEAQEGVNHKMEQQT